MVLLSLLVRRKNFGNDNSANRSIKSGQGWNSTALTNRIAPSFGVVPFHVPFHANSVVI